MILPCPVPLPAPRERTISQHLADIGVVHLRILGDSYYHRLYAGNVLIGDMTAFEAADFCAQAECAA